MLSVKRKITVDFTCSTAMTATSKIGNTRNDAIRDLVCTTQPIGELSSNAVKKKDEKEKNAACQTRTFEFGQHYLTTFSWQFYKRN